MNLIFESFVDEANVLSTEGISWRPEGFEEHIISRFFPTCGCLDSKARAPSLNMVLFNGYWGCTFCTLKGFYLGKSMKYPVPGTVITIEGPRQQEEEDVVRERLPVVVPESRYRTDESIRNAMMIATADNPVEGVKGPSELMNLLHFDLGCGFSTDDLHNLFEGVAKFHTSLLLDKAGTDYYIGSPENLAIINSRLQKF